MSKYKQSVSKCSLYRNNNLHWTIGWSGRVELGLDKKYYLPREAAVIIYPQYFKDGEPIMDALPKELKE